MAVLGRRCGSVAVSMWVVGVMVSNAMVTSTNWSAVSVNCARTSMFCSVGWRREINLGEVKCSFVYCSTRSLYCGGGRHL